MRGRWLTAMAARRPDGEIVVKVEENGAWAAPRLRKIPILRGVVVLGESMVKGLTALQWSANVSLGEGEEQLTSKQMAVMFAMSLGIVLVVFFASPALLTGWLSAFLPSFAVHVVEGAVRAGILLGYLALIGRTEDARRLFAYHGAEHKTIHAFEHDLPLDAAHIQPFSCAHPRCGTSFLLAVLVVSTLVFAFIGDVALEWRVLSRIGLVPLIAGVSYEILRFGAVHDDQAWAKVITGPGLWLQRLTTREPDDAQVEVAVTAFQALRTAEAASTPPPDTGVTAEINA